MNSLLSKIKKEPIKAGTIIHRAAVMKTAELYEHYMLPRDLNTSRPSLLQLKR